MDKFEELQQQYAENFVLIQSTQHRNIYKGSGCIFKVPLDALGVQKNIKEARISKEYGYDDGPIAFAWCSLIYDEENEIPVLEMEEIEPENSVYGYNASGKLVCYSFDKYKPAELEF